ncbi:hypothetical protein AVEN_160665-1 [Araneus ventricosus]|uniref:Uncharacterized protein n=1 Tax=Araneus ventricosus TaxID=182803 RepID=A0A4Y2N8D3_ARAVE|nr:hypothetical protein AVEN_241612-1 [Araneus ventricosus]GBN34773.1 hypothetical protein AVEN_268733-1 [Araneus ventricosus]GBN34910.1 hypothetical protein AVEN_160665-1 [Araneus ventricosus]
MHQGYIETDLAILKHAQMTRMTPERHPRHNFPHHTNGDGLTFNRFNVHLGTGQYTCWISYKFESGILNLPVPKLGF